MRGGRAETCRSFSSRAVGKLRLIAGIGPPEARPACKAILTMDLDDQFRRYFGTAELAAVSLDALAAGTDRMRVDFGIEEDAGRRFALWAMLFLLGSAPDLDIAFKDEKGRDSARNFMDLIAAAEKERHPT